MSSITWNKTRHNQTRLIIYGESFAKDLMTDDRQPDEQGMFVFFFLKILNRQFLLIKLLLFSVILQFEN